MLSVILPNFNHGALIARALSALLSQEPPPMEIIVIDDGSTDDSLTIIRQLAAESPMVRLWSIPKTEVLLQPKSAD